MAKHCPANERVKRDYFLYLKEAKACSDASVDSVAATIARFEQCNGHKDFKRFHKLQAVKFKEYLAAQKNAATGKPLSLATQGAMLHTLKIFFVWLAAQPGFKSRFTYADAHYFSQSDKDSRAAQTHTARPFPSLEQAQRVIRSMPAATVIEQRDRALMAFILLTGCRDRAAVSLNLQHIDLAAKLVWLDARNVTMKNSKTVTTYFMPVGDDIRAMFCAWIGTLKDDHQWGPCDPLFPATLMLHDPEHGFRAGGIKREHWTTANAVRRIFSDAFKHAGLPAFHPHSFRHTLAHLGMQICTTPEAVKAWSQNLGHEHVMTTFNSYGNVALDRQGEIIGGLGNPTQREADDLMRGFADFIKGKVKG